MTVKELIEKLQKCDEDSDVYFDVDYEVLVGKIQEYDNGRVVLYSKKWYE